MVSTGDLRHPITFKVRSLSSDQYGQPNRSYTTYKVTRANKTAASAREVNLADRVTSQVIYTFVVRFDPNITTNMTIEDSLGQYSIHQVMDRDGRNKWLHITATNKTDRNV